MDDVFDNLKVTHNRGRIIEENHYYAYGLKIAAISSKKLGDANDGHLENKHLFNDKELIDDADLGWYDYGFRNYDPQIGRFPQLDPLTDDYTMLTPYQYGSCDPVTNIDIDGLEGGSSVMAPVLITYKPIAPFNPNILKGAQIGYGVVTVSTRAAIRPSAESTGGPQLDIQKSIQVQNNLSS